MNKKNAFSQQEVSTALELLASTLEDERVRIYGIGANAMKALDAKTALSVIQFARKLEEFQKKVRLLGDDWSALIEEKVSAPQKVQEIVDGDGKLFGMRTRKSKTGFTRNVTQPMAAKTNFTVRFPDGTIIFNHKACDTFVQTIERVGESRVRELNLICAGEPLVSEAKSRKYPTGSKKTVAGLYVQTQSSTAAKIKFLKTISTKLKIGLTIQPPATNKTGDLPGLQISPAEETLSGESWMIPANGKLYDHEGAFNRFGYIDWKQGKFRFQVGDIVYIYCTLPIGKVRYKAIVDRVNMNFDEISDDREFWSDPSKYESAKGGNYMRLRLLEKKDNEILNLTALCAHGLVKAPQTPMKVKADLLNYLEEVFAE